jgi:glycosyltransferase involved in cell wall biosynthesis
MTVSKEDEESALKLGIARSGQVETIYNGVDTERFNPARFTAAQRQELRDRLGIPTDAYVIGIVGRLVREKGFFELFEAAKTILEKHPNVRIMAVGDVLPSDYDGTKHEVHARLNELGIADKVAFAGMVDDTAPYLRAMDAFTLPSYREGMPISLLEAMSMELPCVATDIRGCREEIVDCESGWLVPSKNSTSLAEKLLWFIDNPDRARQMGHRARQRVLEHFEINKVVAHQLEIYKRLTAKL